MELSTINIDFRKQVDGGQLGVNFTMLWIPIRKVIDGSVIILPKGFTVKLYNGKAAIKIQPNTEQWCWVVYENINDTHPRYLDVGLGTYDYTALLDVDPSTLKPSYPIGPKGDTGTQGAAGATGAKGDRGVTGSQGSPGPKGDKGGTGTQGVQGPTGPKGDPGIQGFQGIQGSTGPTGSVGTSVTIKGSVTTSTALPAAGNSSGDGWITSDTGNLWVWSGTVFNNVGTVKGPKGDAGAQGIQGVQGTQGPKGDMGAQGMQGVQGLTGTAGTTGTAGAKGDPGTTGATGAKGDPGIQGIQGLKGTTGTSGAKGDKGDPGGENTTGGSSALVGPIATNAVSATVNVVFPVGFFTAAPSGVSFSGNDPRVTPVISGLSKDGFSLRGFNYTSAASNAVPTIYWIAVK